jgi:molybdopterin-guanine dinucleotide biosynthesis protein A
VIAADMPFLNRELIGYMIGTAEGFDYVIPRMGKFYEPLHAIYSKNCISPIEDMINRDRRVIIELFDYVKVRYVDTEEIDRFDPEHLSFFNINTKQDLERARKIESGIID